MISPRRAAAVLAGLVLGVTVVLLSGGPGRADDGDAVFCLGHQRPRLVDTAVMLGLADRALGHTGDVRPKKGVDMTLEVWRKDHGDDFDQACAALVSTVQLEKSGRAPGPSRLETMLTVLVPLVAGSLLTWLIGLQMAVYHGRQALAASLRASSRLMRNEAETLVRALSGPPGTLVPSTDLLWRARADLVTQLEQVSVLRRGKGLRPAWVLPGAVAEGLYHESFMDNFTARRFKDDKLATRTAVLKEIEKLALRVEQVARALQQPFRRHPEMRGAKL